MAKAKKKSKVASKAKSRSSGAKRPGATQRGRRAAPMDAIALLKADHRQVETWFEQFEKSRSDDRKAQLAEDICAALTIHTRIEEEVFYPAFLDEAGDEDIHHEAVVEHDGAKKLIREIQEKGPGDDYFDARVSVLGEMIRHHVKEEEQRDGMFAKARAAGLDLVALGERMAARKQELEAGADAAPAPGSE